MVNDFCLWWLILKWIFCPVPVLWFVIPSLCMRQFRSYSLKAGREGKPLPIILCDTMGLEENAGSGLATDDISNILKGHLPDRYQVHHVVTWSRILNLWAIDLALVNIKLSPSFLSTVWLSSTPLFLWIRRPTAIVSLQCSRTKSTVWPTLLMPAKSPSCPRNWRRSWKPSAERST